MPQQIGKSVYTVQDFVTWQRTKRPVLSPRFQRRPVWTLTDKSYFLDTVIRSIQRQSCTSATSAKSVQSRPFEK